ncbi:MAG TPA: hypothetical protein VMF69_08700 [Gemmataceae bacterium]|nr:hypothetical protein [Gemmataceae bacterium]
MTIRTWIRRLLDQKPRLIRKDLVRSRPRLEPLEDRTLLSTVSGPVVATNTSALIQDINNANNGTGPTTIQLQAAGAANVFDFSKGYNSANNALPQITAHCTLQDGQRAPLRSAKRSSRPM